MSRNRAEPYLELPGEFFSGGYLKPYEMLTDEQKYEVTKGKYRCLPVYPTQLYSSGLAVVVFLILYLFWRWGRGFEKERRKVPAIVKSGSTFALMFILYSICRFSIEFVRDDNPFGANGLTISQNLSIAMFIFGFVLLAIFAKMKPEKS